MARRWEEGDRSERGRYVGGSGERDWTDRMGDEARSWMGDDEAEYRRRIDRRRERGGHGAEHERGYYGGSPRGGGRYGAGPEGTGRYSEADYEAGYRGRAGRGRAAPPEYSSYEREGYAQRPIDRHDYDLENRGFFERAGDEVASWFGDEEAERRRRMDKGHRGRGPKGYTRSDDRIREDVSDLLSDDWSVDASDIEVGVSNREVTLSGTVSDRSAKRRAEDLAESVSGVQHVQNNLRVGSAGRMGDQAGATPGSGTGSTGAGGL